MAYSSISYSANSSANSGRDYAYSFPAVVHDTDNIKVDIGGTTLTTSQYSVVQGTITLTTAPGGGSAPFDAALSASNILKVYRVTNRTTAEVVFSANAVIQDEDLNAATDQGRYLALEAVDRANESIAIDETDSTRYNVQIDATDKRIYGIATPTNDKDAVNKAYADANVAAAASSASDASDSADEAEDWATKVDGYVSGSGNAAKAWAIGGTFVTDTPLRGAAKEWATADEDDTVDGTLFSAKHHSAKAAAQVGLATTQVGLATDQKTLATAQAEAAANSAAAVAAVYDDFADKYLGQMADGATATSGTANGTWAKNASSITLASTSGTIEVGQLVAGTGIPAGANILSIDGSTIVITNSMAALGSAVALTFTGHGIYGAYHVAKDGPPTDNDGDVLATGMLYFNATDNEMRIYDGGNWIAASAAGSSSLLEYKFVTTSGQVSSKTYSGTADVGGTLSYTVSNVMIFLNGVLLKDTTDYTATNGTSVVLVAAPALNDELTVIAFKSFSVSTVEGDNLKSTGQSGGTKFLREDGSGSASWESPFAAPVFTTSIKVTGQSTAPSGTAGMMYYDSDTDLMYVHNGASWQLLIAVDDGFPFTHAYGGEVANYTGYRSHTFFFAGVGVRQHFTVIRAMNVDYLVVAGGGGGGGGVYAGGGGAGGLRTATGYAVTAQTYTIIVGNGGAGAVGTHATATGLAEQGGDSTFATITATGGGRGSYFATSSTGGTGGSGGGSGYNGSIVAGGARTASPVQGNVGGGSGVGDSGWSGGGGGGAAGAGISGDITGATGSAGGAGERNSFRDGNASGTDAGIHVFAGGGGGSVQSTDKGGLGGKFGSTVLGGVGGDSGTNTNIGEAGVADTGSGGGGGGINSSAVYSPGGNGSTGIVVIRYAV